MNRRIATILSTCLAVALASCSREVAPDPDDLTGKEIQLAADTPKTRADYSPMTDPYSVTIRMFEYGNTTPLDSAVYAPASGKTDGTLAASSKKKLYWPGNVKQYGFTATAGLKKLGADQSTAALLLSNDLISGFSAIGTEEDLTYRTSKDWYKDNGNNKRVPLKFQHQRARITVILKAGLGVGRKEIAFPASGLDARIFSYTDATEESSLAVKPLAAKATINYEADDNGAAETKATTTKYDAIVDPFSYKDNPDLPILRVTVNGQQFTYYAANDEDATDSSIPEAYELTAGKHLTLTVTLSRDSRKVLITALLEDWNEVSVSTICDDYGANGEPIIIKNVVDLKKFLGDEEQNKPGSVAIVSATEMNLDSDGAWNPGTYTLNSTLNLAGCIMRTKSRVFNEISPAGVLAGGSVVVGSNVDAALATTNNGTIDRMNISGGAGVHATSAGLVETNTGIISSCTSALTVIGTDEYVGGIAARSLFASEDGDALTPTIDKCSVTAKVTGSGYTALGGIVGLASGKVNANDYEYGITLSQDKTNSKNILGEQSDDTRTFEADGNTWPTIDSNGAAVANAQTGHLYTGIVDCQEELASVIEDHNSADQSFRFAVDFEIDNTWATPESGTLLSAIDGNSKTITTNGKMLFHGIGGEVKDFTIICAENVESVINESHTDGIAALAFEVSGEDAHVTGVKVKTAEGKHIKASIPAGLIVRAIDNATIEYCEVLADIQIDLTGLVGDMARNFIGGIAATADNATFIGCQTHTGTSLTVASATSTHIYFGGILGGCLSASSGGKATNVLITDCNSWWWVDDNTPEHHVGAIVGRSGEDSNNSKQAIQKGSQGNWWKNIPAADGTNTVMAVGELPKNITDETRVIGKCNSVTPSETIY